MPLSQAVSGIIPPGLIPQKKVLETTFTNNKNTKKHTLVVKKRDFMPQINGKRIILHTEINDLLKQDT